MGRWNDFESNISRAFRELREDKDFFDVTLACDDEQLQAHKVILSACSPFFRTILRCNKHEHPLLYLKGVKYADLVSVLNFMYHGEVNVAQEELNTFLAVAEDLKVKGLTQNNSESKQKTSFPPEASKSRPRDLQERTEPPPPTKRPRPAPPPAPRAPPASYHHDDDDIQEVVPVKSEPVSLPPDTPRHSLTPMAQMEQVEQAYSTPQVDQMASGVVVDPNMGYGDEEENEDYGGYEGADGSYEGGVLDNSGMTMGGQDGNKELDLLLATALTRDPASGEWMCKYCPKAHKNKARISRHAEVHFPGFSQQCPYCEKVLASRNSLRTHVSDAHTKGQSRQHI